VTLKTESSDLYVCITTTN